MARRLVPLALLLIALLGASACARERSGPARRLNVILVVVDTLRADHLGIYGYGRGTSPNVDAFARRSVLFRNARSQAACTSPSVNSILTSRYPGVFLGQPDRHVGIPPSIPTVAEILRGQGYQTVAISASALVRNKPSQRNPYGGFGAGFDLFLESCTWKPARCANRQAFRQLAQRRESGRPLFLYLHYIDPHDPYAPPGTHPLRYARGTPGKDFIREGSPNPIAQWLYRGGPDPGVTPADLRHLQDLYDDEIAYFDTQFAELVRTLEAGGWLDDTIVVFAADHGEEFLEHGHIMHCRSAYEALIKTPLFFHIPGVPATTIASPVQNLDIVPTVLDYLGVPEGEAKLEGRSLRPLIETGREEGEPYQYSSGGGYRSVSDGRYKLLLHLGRKQDAWLFDLQRDPGETSNVLAAERRRFHHLSSRLSAWLARTEGEANESLRKSQETEKTLRSLGYLQ